MKNKYKIFFLLFIVCLSVPLIDGFRNTSFAQNRKIDSLLTLLKKDKVDTSKIDHINELCVLYKNIGLFDTSMKYANWELQLAQQLNRKKYIANSYNNIGINYRNQGNYSMAIDYYFKALKIAEELKAKEDIAAYMGNIGIIYAMEDEYSKSLDYFLKAIKMDERLGRKDAVARDLGNIGAVYSKQKDYFSALDYYFKALKMAKELGDKNGMVRHWGNIGGSYLSLKNFSQALDYCFKALSLAEELKNRNGIAINSGTIGSAYMETKKYKEAEKYMQRSFSIADSIGALELKMDQEASLSELYEKMGKPIKALEYYKKSVVLKDTLFNQNKNKEITSKAMNYEFDKKEAIAKIQNEEKNRKQTFIIWSVAFGLFLVAVFAGFVFRSLRITSKQKQTIEQQKKIVEEHQKEIIDSITYAKRIQNALLREEEHISKHLPEHFILFMPKDIVSGDFYWGAEKHDYWYFAAADCTGHGVPGAIMSMLGISFLNDIVSSEELLSPAEILNRLRNRIIDELRQTGEDGGSKDGMDISLVRLNLKTNELQWAGANNALNLIRNEQLEEVKADKQPIGYHPEQHPFTNHEMQLQKGDCIYIYSDGYADQFGGTKGKKFTYKRLEDLIMKQKEVSMNNQKVFFKRHFIEWKGSLEQVDDVCVFGVRV